MTGSLRFCRKLKNRWILDEVLQLLFLWFLSGFSELYSGGTSDMTICTGSETIIGLRFEVRLRVQLSQDRAQ